MKDEEHILHADVTFELSRGYRTHEMILGLLVSSVSIKNRASCLPLRK
jgi:hypothetical protein